MYENDYILRVVDQIGIMIRAMLDDLRANKTGEVYETSREALQLLLGLPPTVVEKLTAEGYVAMLSMGGAFDAKRGRLAAEVLARRAQAAEQAGDHLDWVAEREKALRLIDFVLETGDEDDRAEAAALRDELSRLP